MHVCVCVVGSFGSVATWKGLGTDIAMLLQTSLQVLNIRRLLTEILLTVTNDEITNIAQEAYDAALKGRQTLLYRTLNGFTVGHAMVLVSKCPPDLALFIL